MSCHDNLYRNLHPRHVSRRWFFEQCGIGLGSMALVNLLAGAASDRARPRVGDRLQLLEAADLGNEPLWRLHLQDVGDAFSDGVEGGRVERHAHAPLGAELVDEQRPVGTLDVLEEERRPAGLDGAVGDLRDLELGIYLGGDANELAFTLEQRNPSAEIRGRRHPRSV